MKAVNIVNVKKVKKIREGDSPVNLNAGELIDLYHTNMRSFVKEKFWKNKCKYTIEVVILALYIQSQERGSGMTPYDIIDGLTFEGINELYSQLEHLDNYNVTILGTYIDTLQADVSNFNWIADILIGMTKKLFPEIVQKVEMLGAIKEKSSIGVDNSEKIKGYKI